MWLGLRFVVCLNQQPLKIIDKREKRKKHQRDEQRVPMPISVGFIRDGLSCRRTRGMHALSGMPKERTPVSQSHPCGLGSCRLQRQK